MTDATPEPQLTRRASTISSIASSISLRSRTTLYDYWAQLTSSRMSSIKDSGKELSGQEKNNRALVVDPRDSANLKALKEVLEEMAEEDDALRIVEDPRISIAKSQASVNNLDAYLSRIYTITKQPPRIVVGEEEPSNRTEDALVVWANSAVRQLGAQNDQVKGPINLLATIVVYRAAVESALGKRNEAMWSRRA